MKLLRFSASGQSCWGRVEGDVVRVMAGSPFDHSLMPTEAVEQLDNLQHLSEIKEKEKQTTEKDKCGKIRKCSKITT